MPAVTGCSLVGRIVDVLPDVVVISAPAFHSIMYARIRDCMPRRMLVPGDVVLFNLASERWRLPNSVGLCAVGVTIAQPDVVAALPEYFA